PVDRALLRFGVYDLGLFGIEYAGKTVPATDIDPVGVQNPLACPGATGPHPVEVVLQPAADAIRRTQVEVDPVKLSRGHAVEILPGLAAVVALVGTAIGAEQKPLGMVRVDC